MSKRPMTEAQMAEWNERVRAEARAEAQKYRRPQDPGPSPSDQYWSEQRTWTGEVLYRPGTPGNEFVRHAYDPFQALKDD